MGSRERERVILKKTIGCLPERKRPSANKQELALLFLFAGLVEVRELRLLRQFNLLVRVSLVVELEGVVGVGEVLLCLILHPVVGGNPVQQLRAVFLVFSIGRLVGFKGLVVPHSPFLCGFRIITGQTIERKSCPQ